MTNENENGSGAEARRAELMALVPLADIRRQVSWSTPSEDRDFDHSGALAFQGREGYLAHVAGWKIHWHAVVAECRAAKAAGDRSKRETLRRVARILLELRALGKGRARASRAAEVAAAHAPALEDAA